MPRLIKPGRTYAICCAADISAEVKDRFLQLNLDFDDYGQSTHNLVFVDSLTEIYVRESIIGGETASSPSSPFKGKSVQECSLLLQQLRRGGSDVNHELFAIFDERSRQDGSVLMVQKELLTEGEEAADDSVRVAFEMVEFEFGAWMLGDSCAAEDCIKARRQEDCVLRSPSEERLDEQEWARLEAREAELRAAAGIVAPSAVS